MLSSVFWCFCECSVLSYLTFCNIILRFVTFDVLYVCTFCRLEENADLRYANAAQKSALSARVRQTDGSQQAVASTVKVLGAKSSNNKISALTPELFKMVLREYMLFDLVYADLMTKFNARRNKRITLNNWKPSPCVNVTPAQKRMMTAKPRVTNIGKAEMDGILFRTQQNQSKFVIDNACIIYPYNKNGRTLLAYGVITRMFVHEMPSTETVDGEVVNTKNQKVFIECDWFKTVGTNPFTGLTQIIFEPNWNAMKVVMLEKCKSKNCVFWPSNPFTTVNRLASVFDLKIQQLDVIMHHETTHDS